MTAEEWKEKITLNCKDVGTYRNSFDDIIDTLADILERRDETVELYKESNSKAVVEYTNKSGQTNLVKNPVLVTINELNASALTYWRDLGLTPKGLKGIDEQAVKVKKTSGLNEMLKALSIDE